ncbi:hypothetical protein [Colwellia psychrerythraea]|uniref:Uncharacterized protein n=1 Tax=Colwellia psychrerythraea TaxID=28229 RepID=A0A099KCJ5_COLPS|nr:hypothetical protein [Colwellia psychrerythraea]KGJ87752.1 hypothetical protein GAB14E_4430 [Colwellia psychrerythraea]
MSNNSNFSNRRMIMPAELLSLYKSNNQITDHCIDVVEQNHEQNLALLTEQFGEQEDNAMYVLGYN